MILFIYGTFLMRGYDQLFHRRYETVLRHQHLQKHAPLFELLGPLGMSSDEEIEDPSRPKGRRQYGVRRKPWLSNAVHDLKGEVDKLSDEYAAQIFVRGSRPHERIPTHEVSTNEYIARHLPTNAYADAFMATANPALVEIIDRDPNPHPF